MYRWEQCIRTPMGDTSMCSHCTHWNKYITDNPSHYALHGFKDPYDSIDRTLLDRPLMHLEPITASAKNPSSSCASCGKGINSSYPGYHVHSSIIARGSEVPNPVRCGDCRV